MMLDESKISCCTIVADCVIPDAPGKLSKSSYVYYVPAKDIAEYIRFISETFAYFGQPCSRVYISGFIISTESSIWNKERIVSQIKMITERNNALINEKTNFLHREK